MIVGIAKEIKNNEYRVACTPNGVKEFVKRGHTVLVEKDAGIGSGFSNEEYIAQGAEIVETAEELYKRLELIYKVKEILEEEYKYLREDLIVFTYIHSNAHREQTDKFLESKAIGIAYEDVYDRNGGFPLLKPMSEIAGKGGFIAALNFSQSIHGGNGLMLARVHGVRTPEITIIGAGNAGLGAAELAAAFGNKVTILDVNTDNLEHAKHILPPNVELLYSDEQNLINCLKRTDVLMNCILWPKWRTDHLVSREMLKLMKPNSLIVDVSCDDNGAIETSRSTSHDDPVYVEEGITHYVVDNIPAAFPQTSTYSLCNATLPFALQIADKGVKQALIDNKYLRRGLTSYEGQLTLEETGKKQDRPYISPEKALGMED
ncbi:alanine dehydrogenase [Anaerosalibacter bizertensis]|uniref:alanine dehydrogenase n=1 Tax=Anaerosalibacter bizertensis TaxID=932217 RepID=UPI001C0ECB1B|nr:alanine dehydrogenase [Anaerosalibacter bizertensis]MBU5292934.1 alanine dehydrogenase [Anaerosalibacter bizertensis]